MDNRREGPMRVSCTDCSYLRTVTPNDDESPADVVIRHGREMGHQLSVSPVEPEDTGGKPTSTD